MKTVDHLVTEHIDLCTSAIKAKATTGRGSNKKRELYGIKKLRELILELAVRGKLVPQDSSDEPASVLLERITKEKERLIQAKKIKKSKALPDIAENEKPFELPSDWRWVRLQDITSYIQRGKGPKYADVGKVKVVSQKCVQWSGFDITPARFVADQSLEKYQEERYLQSLDLLWNSTGTGTVGRVNVLYEIKEKSIVADSHVTVLRPLLISSNFLWTYIAAPGVQSRIEPDHETALVSGSTKQVELNTSAAVTLVCPLPPLAEQHRIVAKVDELMALCDQLEQQTETNIDAHATLVETLLATLTNSAGDVQDAQLSRKAGKPEATATELEENWNRIAEHFDTLFTTEHSIDQLKQTILQLAVMGKLVPQDPNDEPASVLLEKIAAEKAQLIKDKKIKKQKALPPIGEDEKPFALPEGWEWCHLGQLINLVSGQHLKPSEYSESKLKGGFPYITGPAEFGETYPTYNKYTLELRSLALPGDILVTCKGAGLGKLNMVNETIAISRQLMSIQPIVVESSYIRLIVDSLYKYFQDKGVGIAIPGISRDDVTGIRLQLPPLLEQNRIVTKVDQLMSLCDHLKACLQQTQKIQVHLADTMTEQVIGKQENSKGPIKEDKKDMEIHTLLSIGHLETTNDAPIATLVKEAGDAADAKSIWSKSRLPLPDFYKQLKIEIDAGYLAMPAQANYEL